MSQIVPLDKLFLPANIQKSVGKAIDILDQVEGKNIEEKLTNIGKKYQSLKIVDLSDEENYQIVHSALLDLQKVRVAIKKVGKSWRDNLTAQNREELEIERQLLSLFEETEKALREEKDRIDNLKMIEERRSLLPMRLEMLKSIEIDVNEEEILSMNEKEFSDFYNEKKLEFEKVQEERRKKVATALHEKRHRLIVDTELFQHLDDKYQYYGEMTEEEFQSIVDKTKKNKSEWMEKEAQRAKEEAEKVEKELKLQAEKEKQQAIKEVEERAERERQKLIEEQVEKDRREKEAELKKQREEEQKRLAELEEKERAEKNKRFISWKKRNNFDPKTDIIKRDGDTFMMYRFVSKISFPTK